MHGSLPARFVVCGTSPLPLPTTRYLTGSTSGGWEGGGLAPKAQGGRPKRIKQTVVGRGSGPGPQAEGANQANKNQFSNKKPLSRGQVGQGFLFERSSRFTNRVLKGRDNRGETRPDLRFDRQTIANRGFRDNERAGSFIAAFKHSDGGAFIPGDGWCGAGHGT